MSFTVRRSARSFLRTPGLSIALLLTIAFGIGSNVTIYSFAHGVAPRLAVLLRLAAAGVFLIACTNVTLLLLGRALARSHETALRIALGAGRAQLAREQLSDSIVVSIAGGAAGLLLAVWTSRLLPLLLYERDAGELVFAPDLLEIVAASAACIAITVVCGLIAILAVPHSRPEVVLRRENAGPSTLIRRLRLGLVVAQMACCCILVVSTAFLIDGLRSAMMTAAGRRLGRALFATVQADHLVGMRYFSDVEAAAKPVAVSAIAWAARLPGSQPESRSFRIEPAISSLRKVALNIDWFTADKLEFFRLPPVAGRMFGLPEETCRAAVVNEQAARLLFGAQTPGRVLRDPANMPVEIIGVLAEQRPGRAPTIYFNHKAVGQKILFSAQTAASLPAAELDTNVVSPNYFESIGLTLLAGEGFTAFAPAAGCRIGIVNQEAADLYFGGKPIGAALIDDRGYRTAIVGVVNSAGLGGFQSGVQPMLYLPMSQDALRMTMIVPARDATARALADLRRRIESVPGHGPAPIVVKTLETHLRQTSLAPLHIATAILSGSAGLGFLLCILGLFGALSDAARQRRRELAVRVALGAPRWHLIGQVLGQGGRLALAGGLAGTFGSFLLSRRMTGIVAGSGPPALWVWLAAPAVLAVAVVVASLLPARRAVMANPLMIMRSES